MALPQVFVLSLGGTISSTDTDDGGVTPTLTGEALIEDVPEISQVAEVSAKTFRQVGSSALTLDDLIELSREIEDLIDRGASGVVVCPAGFVADHLEVLYDLDVEAAAAARALGLPFTRTVSPNADRRLAATLADVVAAHLPRHLSPR